MAIPYLVMSDACLTAALSTSHYTPTTARPIPAVIANYLLYLVLNPVDIHQHSVGAISTTAHTSILALSFPLAPCICNAFPGSTIRADLSPCRLSSFPTSPFTPQTRYNLLNLDFTPPPCTASLGILDTAAPYPLRVRTGAILYYVPAATGFPESPAPRLASQPLPFDPADAQDRLVDLSVAFGQSLGLQPNAAPHVCVYPSSLPRLRHPLVVDFRRGFTCVTLYIPFAVATRSRNVRLAASTLQSADLSAQKHVEESAIKTDFNAVRKLEILPGGIITPVPDRFSSVLSMIPPISDIHLPFTYYDRSFKSCSGIADVGKTPN
ncbi:hypothetical protein B0H17DRAFT_1222462 [Mycena rosella]|uniref:Uncharacterized protein n=1 Tax=Mycena rosella TaxID=1033263 RepID=A0AAD7AY51_MYCRO|nr:hypothetical protein B0H17DRAFT_1222462 [Mycena rosella]